MPFVKLDCGILNSTLWIDRAARELFITALLMAEPYELADPTKQIAIGSLEYTGWEVPPGWYGFVEAAGPGIIYRAGLDDNKGPMYHAAHEALRRLGEPEPASRSHDFDGRRLVRVDGGFIVLNFIKYREKDSTTAERSKRWRERQKEKQVTRVTNTPTRVIRHQAEAEAEVEVQKKKKSAHTSGQSTGGAMSGSLPRNHLDHAVCGRVCLHNTQFGQFVGKFGGDPQDAVVQVRAWAIRVLDEWNLPPKLNQSIGGGNFPWWDARWVEWQGPVTPAVAPKRSEADSWAWTQELSCPHDPKCGSAYLCDIQARLIAGRKARP